MQPKLLLLPLAFLAMYFSRAQTPVEVQYKTYAIDRSVKDDSAMMNMLQSYTDSVDKYINAPIGFTNTTLYKKQPESPLGNLMADAMLWYASKVFSLHIDAAFINNGSVRSYISKGEISLQTLQAISPYDNYIVLQKVNGNILHQLLDLIAYKGGWPCTGISMKIKYKKAADILIQGSPLQDTATYTIALSDYLAKGGDGCTMLRSIAQQNKNVLYKEALIAYVKSFTAAGKPVNASIENRIVNVEE